MRKIIVVAMSEVALWAGGAGMELLNIAPLQTGHWLLMIFAVSVMILGIALAWPWLNPTERIIRDARERRKREQDARLRRIIDGMRKRPWTRSIRVIDPDRGLVEAVGDPPPTWRDRLMKVLARLLRVFT